MNQPPLSKWRWVFYAVGSAMMAWGIWGQLFGDDTKPRRVFVLWVVAALGHDLVLAPTIVLLGVIARRVFRGRVRSSVQGAALVAGVLVLVAIPGMGRFGAKADNSSVLPRDYRLGLLLALGVVLTIACSHAVVDWLRARRRRASIS